MIKGARPSRIAAGAVLVFAILVFAASMPAFAQTSQSDQAAQAQAARPVRPAARLRAPAPLRPLLLQLRAAKLTAEQRQQVQGILKGHSADLKAFAARTRAARQAWQQAGKIDINERKSLAEQRTALLQSVRTEVLNVLTPEQRARIEALGLRRRR